MLISPIKIEQNCNFPKKGKGVIKLRIIFSIIFPCKKVTLIFDPVLKIKIFFVTTTKKY